MKPLPALSIALLLLQGTVLAQNRTRGKVYLSQQLEYLQFINDSTIWLSIGRKQDPTGFYIKGNTLFVQDFYYRTNFEEKQERIPRWNRLTIVHQSPDSLFLLNPTKTSRRYGREEDTLKFIALPRLAVPVTRFTYLKMDYFSPYNGTLQVSIDSLGNMRNDRSPEKSKGGHPVIQERVLTQTEMTNFLELLSNTLPHRLPRLRECNKEEATVNFEIVYNGKLIQSKGCKLKWIHAFLFEYLYELDRNRER